MIAQMVSPNVARRILGRVFRKYVPFLRVDKGSCEVGLGAGWDEVGDGSRGSVRSIPHLGTEGGGT